VVKLGSFHDQCVLRLVHNIDHQPFVSSSGSLETFARESPRSEERRKKRLCRLSEAELDPVYQVFVYDRDRKLLEFFDQKGIRPGTRLKVRSRNYDGTLSLAVEKKNLELGGSAADKVWLAKSR